ncbi:transcriptional regulator, TetR family [Actinobacteria bacterium OK074]|nr:transcriptional regulator, TetR family [Actinobacteria bacterium OK074]
MTEPLVPFPAPPEDLGGRMDLTLTPTVTVGSPAPPLRADAARNRIRLLEVAAWLVAERGVANVTMEDVAVGAGVGKGTVFRRFGDRIGLFVALLDHHEQQLQSAFLSGPPPLGPGVPALDRLRAFGSAVLRHEHAHRDLYLAAHADAPRRRAIPAYGLRLSHVCMLLRQIAVEGDVEVTAHILLGSLDTALADHLLTRRNMSMERLEAGWRDLVARYTERCSGTD